MQQEGTTKLDKLDTALDFFEPSQRLFHQSDTLHKANWKLLTETLLEAYYIKSLHRESFYLFQREPPSRSTVPFSFSAIDVELSIPKVEFSENTTAISIDGSTVFLESDPMGAPGEFINSEYGFIVPKIFFSSDEQVYEINQLSWLIETTEGKTA